MKIKVGQEYYVYDADNQRIDSCKIKEIEENGRVHIRWNNGYLTSISVSDLKSLFSSSPPKAVDFFIQDLKVEMSELTLAKKEVRDEIARLKRLKIELNNQKIKFGEIKSQL